MHKNACFDGEVNPFFMIDDWIFLNDFWTIFHSCWDENFTYDIF